MSPYQPNDVIGTYSGDLDRTITQQPARRLAFNTGQKNEEQGFLGRYTGAVTGQERLPAMYDRIGRELNIPNLRQNAVTLQNTMTNLPFTLSGAARGFDVNNNQLERMISQRAGDLAPAVTAANNAYQSALGEFDTRVGQEQQQQQKDLTPYEVERGMLSDRWAREATGFNQDSQNELQGYIQKMQTGAQLSMTEQQRANELAMAKLSYDAAVYKANKDFEGIKYQTDARNSRDPLGLFG